MKIISIFLFKTALDAVLFEEVMEGAGEEGAILNDGTTTEGEDWNGYTSGDFYWVFLPSSLTQKQIFLLTLFVLEAGNPPYVNAYIHTYFSIIVTRTEFPACIILPSLCNLLIGKFLIAHEQTYWFLFTFKKKMPAQNKWLLVFIVIQWSGW